MKRLVAIMAVTMIINFSFPLMPQAHAAFLEDKLVEAVAQSPSAARVQQLLNLKQNLAQVNKDTVWNAVAKATLERVGKGNVAAALANGDNINSAMETVLRQEIQQGISEKLAPYQKEIAVIATLLNGNSTLNPKAARDNNSLSGAPQNYKRILDMTTTAYAPGPLDNGKWNDQTYMGGKIHKGVVAVDPRIIPMGTHLWIEGYGEAIAEDQGSAIKGNRIDLAFDNRQEALDYGIQNKKVYVLN